MTVSEWVTVEGGLLLECGLLLVDGGMWHTCIIDHVIFHVLWHASGEKTVESTKERTE